MGFEIRADRGQEPGKGRLPGERAEHLRLMDLGYSSAAACRAVGVTVRTGRRWRHGRPPEAPRERGARAGEDLIYWVASRNRYIGAVDLGFLRCRHAHPQEGQRQDRGPRQASRTA